MVIISSYRSRISSIDMIYQIAGLIGKTNFDRAIPIKDVNDNQFLFSLGLTDGGGSNNYIFDASIVPNFLEFSFSIPCGTFIRNRR